MRHTGTRHGLLLIGAFVAITACTSAPDASPGETTEEPVEYTTADGVAYRSLPDTGAVARADSAVRADPQNVEKLLQLGLAQAGIRRYREAITSFTRGMQIQPESGVLFRWRGHRYLSIREFESARSDLERGLQLDSTLYGCWYHLGIVRYVSGDFDGAADAFAHALPLAPDAGEHAGSIDWGWMSLSRAGRTADAQSWLETNGDSITVDNAYARRLSLYRGRIQPEALITAADTADVQVATLNYGLGNWYLLHGDSANARAAFERAVASGGWPAFGFIAAEAELRRM